RRELRIHVAPVGRQLPGAVPAPQGIAGSTAPSRRICITNHKLARIRRRRRPAPMQSPRQSAIMAGVSTTIHGPQQQASSPGSYTLMSDSFNTRAQLTAGGRSFDYFSLKTLESQFPAVAKLPYAQKILLENL